MYGSESKPLLKYNIDPSSGSIPLVFSDDPALPGIFLEIIPLLMQYAEFETEQFNMPTKRAVKGLYAGKLDFDFINPDWITDQTSSETFVFSDSILDVTEYLISLYSKKGQFNSLDATYGKLVGTVAGYYYFDDNRFQRADFRSESEIILGLKYERFTVAIMQKTAAYFWANKHQVNIALGAVHSKGKIVLRLHKSRRDLLPKLNSTIALLHQKGLIKAIIDKYEYNSTDSLKLN